jgi:hypothetical protein
MTKSQYRRSRRRTSPPQTERLPRLSRVIAFITAAVASGGIIGYILFEAYPATLDGQGPLATELARFRAYAVDTMNKQGFGSCRIKGNISFERGERIYHAPGGEYYSRTRIDTAKGERWFCSEAEARAAGWRRSRR